MDLKINSRWIVIFTLFLASFIALLCVGKSHSWHTQQREQKIEEMKDAFDIAIQKEKMQFIKKMVMNFDAANSPDADVISLDEKMAYLNQSYLSRIDPHRHHLDSIYQAELLRRGFSLLTAISYSLDDTTKASCSFTDLQNMTLLKEHTFRNTLKEPPFILRAYVNDLESLPSGLWHAYLLMALGIFGIVLAIYLVAKEWKRALAIATLNIQAQQAQTPFIPEAYTIPTQWVHIAPSILYDETCHLLKDEKSGMEIALKTPDFKIFEAYIHREKRILLYLEIAEIIAPTISNGAMSQQEKDRIRKSIKSLEKQIEPFGFGFENKRNTSYRLVLPGEEASSGH